jgi:predicted secreted protein
MALSGRKLRILKDGVPVIGSRTDGVTFNSEPVYITDKDDKGWRTLLAEAGVRSLSATVEGVLKDDTLVEVAADGTALLDDYTVALDNIGYFNGDWFLSSVELAGEQADAVTFTANIESGSTIAALVNTGLPVLSGTPTEGQTLSVTNGTWLGSPSIARQWQQNDGNGWANIGTETGATYQLATAQVGNTIRVVVTATTAYGEIEVTSNVLGPVAGL